MTSAAVDAADLSLRAGQRDTLEIRPERKRASMKEAANANANANVGIQNSH